MPIYEYRCEDCQQIFEEWQKHFEDQEVTCPVCNGNAKRLISHTSFILKGSGWYVTDYARGKSKSAASNNGNGNGNKKDNKESAGEQKKEASPAKESGTGSEKKSSCTSNTCTSTSA